MSYRDDLDALAATGRIVGGPKDTAARLAMKVQKRMQKLGITRPV